MRIAAGTELPTVQLTVMGANGPAPADIRQLTGSGRTLMFAVPGAFTPTCSAQHLPGFIARAEDLYAAGVDRIICTAVNDIFVLVAWARSSGVADQDGRFIMAADGNGELARALGLEMDSRAFGMGHRSQRYAMIIEDGRVREVLPDAPGEFRRSSADYVLSRLRPADDASQGAPE